MSWTSAGSLVDSYEVMWQRDTSGDCPDEDEGNITITNGSTSHTIAGLEENSNYNVIVRAVNAIGSSKNNSIVVTGEAGQQLHKKLCKKILKMYYYNYSFISPSHLCDYI